MGALVPYHQLYADDVLLFPHDAVGDLLAIGSLTGW